MNRSRILACCTLLMASSAWAQTQAPLTGTMVSGTSTYPVSTSPAAASNQGVHTPAAPAAETAPAERQPYEKYRLSDEEVHPWPEVEGLPVHVQNERRHIPPRIEVGLIPAACSACRPTRTEKARSCRCMVRQPIWPGSAIWRASSIPFLST